MAAGDEYAFGLGRLSMATAHVDYFVHGIAVQLLDPTDPEIGARLLRRSYFRNLISVAHELVSARAKTDDGVASLSERLNDALARAEDLLSVRNRCLHAMWIAAPWETTAKLLSARTEGVMSLPELQGHVAKAEETAHFVSSVWFDLGHHYGVFDALIEATREMEHTWSDDVDGPL